MCDSTPLADVYAALTEFDVAVAGEYAWEMIDQFLLYETTRGLLVELPRTEVIDPEWSPDLAGGMTIDELLGIERDFKPRRKR